MGRGGGEGPVARDMGALGYPLPEHSFVMLHACLVKGGRKLANGYWNYNGFGINKTIIIRSVGMYFYVCLKQTSKSIPTVLI